jgi:hypothetical protein
MFNFWVICWRSGNDCFLDFLSKPVRDWCLENNFKMRLDESYLSKH